MIKRMGIRIKRQIPEAVENKLIKPNDITFKTPWDYRLEKCVCVCV